MSLILILWVLGFLVFIILMVCAAYTALIIYRRMPLNITSVKTILEEERVAKIQSECKHEKWHCDKQIRTIECIECKKRAWIEDYVDLYP